MSQDNKHPQNQFTQDLEREARYQQMLINTRLTALQTVLEQYKIAATLPGALTGMTADGLVIDAAKIEQYILQDLSVPKPLMSKLVKIT